MKVLGIIPARLRSTRLPEKVLLPVRGKPLLWYVYRAAARSRLLDRLFVAADDMKIVRTLKEYNIPCILTSRKHRSGTERVGEAAKRYRADIVVNIQGDEPLIDHRNIDRIVKGFRGNRDADVITLKVPLKGKKDLGDPSVVKVVTDKRNRALYFSRSRVPFDRDDRGKVRYFKHIGIYGYRRLALYRILETPASVLEKAEKLEQLRFLEHGFKVMVLTTPHDSVGVDTPGDYAKVKRFLEP